MKHCWLCARSEVGLSRLPVTEEIAGSNPVERAIEKLGLHSSSFSILGTRARRLKLQASGAKDF